MAATERSSPSTEEIVENTENMATAYNVSPTAGENTANMAVGHSVSTTALESTANIETDVEVAKDGGDIDFIPDRICGKKVCEFYLQGKCRFGDNCHNVHPENAEIRLSPPSSKKKGKQKKHFVEDVIVPKKPPMKTAGDVRDRILWDDDLPSEYFTLGYLDRFAGLVERPFSSFVWGDLCDAGPDDLAIPQHCMSYFKYKGTKVWDKPTRLDHVFGSAGNDVKIIEKMAQIDEQIQKELEEKQIRREENDYSSSDDDDEFDVVMAGGNEQGLVKEVREDWKEFLRASHFVCVKVKDPSVIQEAKKVQECVYHGDPSLRSCAMPEELFHVTLAMVKCETPSAVLRVQELLGTLQPRLQKMALEGSHEDSCSTRRLTARGLSTFGARVLYVKLEVSELFNQTVAIFLEAFRTMEDVTVTNNFNYVPHMTLIKVNRQTERERNSKYMNSSLYDTYLNHNFGDICFDNVHFCSIDDQRGPDGFYLTPMSIDF